MKKAIETEPKLVNSGISIGRMVISLMMYSGNTLTAELSLEANACVKESAQERSTRAIIYFKHILVVHR